MFQPNPELRQRKQMYAGMCQEFRDANVVILSEFEICVVNVVFATQNFPAYLMYEVFWLFKY